MARLAKGKGETNVHLSLLKKCQQSHPITSTAFISHWVYKWDANSMGIGWRDKGFEIWVQLQLLLFSAYLLFSAHMWQLMAVISSTILELGLLKANWMSIWFHIHMTMWGGWRQLISTMWDQITVFRLLIVLLGVIFVGFLDCSYGELCIFLVILCRALVLRMCWTRLWSHCFGTKIENLCLQRW